MTSAPQIRDMFPHASSAAERAQAFEDYKASLDDAYKAAKSGRQQYRHQDGGFSAAPEANPNLAKAAKQLKKLQKGAGADIAGELAQLHEYLVKEIDSGGSGSPGGISLGSNALGQTNGFVPVDLEAPSKKLVPLQTPLRNMLPRDNTGKGTGLSFRRVRGWSNSNSSTGVGDLGSFFSSEGVNTSYAGVSAIRRPNQIAYATDVNTVAYMEQGLGTSVSWRSEYAGQGFEDIRQLAQTALLWATMTAEEKNLLYGRGATSNGYSGTVGAAPAAGSFVVTGVNSGGSLAASTTYHVFATFSTGAGETVAVDVGGGAITTTGTSGSITVHPSATPVFPSGATNINLYLGNPGSVTTAVYVGTMAVNPNVANVFTITSSGFSSATPPAADASFNPNAFDGLLSILTNTTNAAGPPNQNQASGYFSQFSGAPGTSGILQVGDAPFQAAFSALYGATTQPNSAAIQANGTPAITATGAAFGAKLLADPDCVLLDGNIRSALGTYLKATASTTAYRFMLQEERGGATVGSVVSGIYNQVTGKMVDLTVEPYMPLGASLILSKTLPVPDSEISNTFVVKNVQDYMAYEWAPIGMTYDTSTYLFGTLVPYAPAWSGAITGLTP